MGDVRRAPGVLKRRGSFLTNEKALEKLCNLEDPTASAKLRAVWDKYDSEKKGYLTPMEFYNLFVKMCSTFNTPRPGRTMVSEFLKASDKNRNGVISFEEFLEFMREFPQRLRKYMQEQWERSHNSASATIPAGVSSRWESKSDAAENESDEEEDNEDDLEESEESEEERAANASGQMRNSMDAAKEKPTEPAAGTPSPSSSPSRAAMALPALTPLPALPSIVNRSPLPAIDRPLQPPVAAPPVSPEPVKEKEKEKKAFRWTIKKPAKPANVQNLEKLAPLEKEPVASSPSPFPSPSPSSPSGPSSVSGSVSSPSAASINPRPISPHHARDDVELSDDDEPQARESERVGNHGTAPPAKSEESEVDDFLRETEKKEAQASEYETIVDELLQTGDYSSFFNSTNSSGLSSQSSTPGRSPSMSNMGGSSKTEIYEEYEEVTRETYEVAEPSGSQAKAEEGGHLPPRADIPRVRRHSDNPPRPGELERQNSSYYTMVYMQQMNRLRGQKPKTVMQAPPIVISPTVTITKTTTITSSSSTTSTTSASSSGSTSPSSVPSFSPSSTSPTVPSFSPSSTSPTATAAPSLASTATLGSTFSSVSPVQGIRRNSYNPPSSYSSLPNNSNGTFLPSVNRSSSTQQMFATKVKSAPNVLFEGGKLPSLRGSKG